MSYRSGVCVVVVVVVVAVVVSGFNIETERFLLHKGPRDSMFGFSVSHHRDSNGPWVLVGAPEAQTGQVGVDRGGAVYRCSTAAPNDCTQMPFDLTGDHWENGRQHDNKSLQWFGAYVTSTSGVIVACAPRYVWFRPKRREPVGRCFYGTGRASDGYQMMNPCLESAMWGYHQQGSCQAGFSAAITENGNRMYVGAVGSYYWQGQVFYQDTLNTRESLQTPEGPKQFDMGYLGYSLTAGEFTGDLEEDLAVGVPRGNDLKGEVVVLTHDLRVFYNITGEQLGSYFGYSVASCDVNGDGLADLVVGAPWYSPEGNTGLFEVGQVSVFTQTPQHNFQRAQQLQGESTRAHFGLSVTTLGDINRDGFEDFAVGAPNAGLSGAGAVYVYLGSASGPGVEASQVLASEALTQGTVRSFGWSVSGGRDLDENEYPDLVVGAHESNAALLFRTRPVVRVNSTLKFRSAKGIIDLEVLGCSLQDGSDVPCVSLLYCLSYDGHRVPSRLSLEVSLTVDTQAHLSPRMFFLQRERHNAQTVTVELRKNVENCTTVYTYVEPGVRDKLTPLVAELVASLGEEEGEEAWDGGLRPILAPPTPPSAGPPKATIYIKNNCGSDNVCVPNLSVEATIDQTEYIIGSSQRLVAHVVILNSGEDAFQALLTTSVPPDVSYASYSILQNDAQDVTPFCSLSNDQAVCEVGNPLPAGAQITLELVFQPTPTTNASSLAFVFTTSSASEEEDTEDNEMAIALPVTMRSNVDIQGISQPDGTFDYNITKFHHHHQHDHQHEIRRERDIGPQVEHIYDIVNNGPSPLPPTKLYLLWPTRNLANEPLLYLLEPPLVSSPPATCHPAPDVNYLGLQVDESKRLSTTYSSKMFANTEIEGEEEEEDEEEAEEEMEAVTSPRNRRQRLRERKVRTEALTNNNIEHSHQHHHHHHHRRHYHHDPTDKEETRRKKRKRRSSELERELQCGATNCTRVVCEVRSLAQHEHVVIRVRSRLWIDTIEKLGMSEVAISSRVVLAAAGLGESGFRIWSGSVTSVVNAGPRETRRSLKWLVVAGSVLAGLLLLALLSAVLWAMGFFKRKRPRDGAESEPLSTNGFYGNGKT